MSGIGTRASIAAVVASLAIPMTASVARGQSGTMLSQTVTTLKGGTANPVFSFQVKGFKGINTTTSIILEIGPDGFGPTPPTATTPGVRAPDPLLPATARFRVRKTGVAAFKDFTPPATGSTGDNTTFSLENVTVDRSGEYSADARGFYRILIGHGHEIDVIASATETWSLELTDIPAGLRVIASIIAGEFIELTPAAAVCAGTPTTCPLGESCRGPCPFKNWCPRWDYFDYREIIWPLPKGPIPCIRCSPLWKLDFDRSRFERVFATWVPTNEQRIAVDRAGSKSVRFTVKGGELIGDVFEGNGGEYTALVQSPKGQPALVAITAAGKTVGQFQAVPPKEDAQTPYDKLAYGLGGVILGALGGLAARMRGGASPGDTKGPPGTKPV